MLHGAQWNAKEWRQWRRALMYESGPPPFVLISRQSHPLQNTS
jgi:hypothetical protein